MDKAPLLNFVKALGQSPKRSDRRRLRSLLNEVIDNMIENAAWEPLRDLLYEQLGYDAITLLKP